MMCACASRSSSGCGHRRGAPSVCFIRARRKAEDFEVFGHCPRCRPARLALLVSRSRELSRLSTAPSRPLIRRATRRPIRVQRRSLRVRAVVAAIALEVGEEEVHRRDGALVGRLRPHELCGEEADDRVWDWDPPRQEVAHDVRGDHARRARIHLERRVLPCAQHRVRVEQRLGKAVDAHRRAKAVRLEVRGAVRVRLHLFDNAADRRPRDARIAEEGLPLGRRPRDAARRCARRHLHDAAHVRIEQW
eukprot:3073946-Prymnesium_polylepis.2